MKKLFHSISKKIRDTSNKAAVTLTCKRGEIATSTIGGIIVGVVIIGLLILAINQFFPDFFEDMFDDMADKLNDNW